MKIGTENKKSVYALAILGVGAAISLYINVFSDATPSAPPKSMDGRACRSGSRRNATKPAADARPIRRFLTGFLAIQAIRTALDRPAAGRSAAGFGMPIHNRMRGFQR